MHLFRMLALVALTITTQALSETPLGSIYVTDGGAAYNRTAHVIDGGTFAIPQGSKITVQCTAPVYVCTDNTTCSSEKGIKIDTDVAFPTSVGPAPESGSALVSVRPVSGSTVICTVHRRTGNEM